MCRNCILVLFLPLYLNLYTNIQTKLPFTKVFLTKTDETNDASGIVSISSNHGNFSAGLYIKQGSSRGSLQCFSSSSPARGNVTLRRVQSLFLSMMFFFFIITYQIHLDETKLMTLLHIF